MTDKRHGESNPAEANCSAGHKSTTHNRRKFISNSARKITVFASAGTLAALAAACGGGGGSSPMAPTTPGGGGNNGGGGDGESGLTIDISQSQYSALQTVGGTVTLSGNALPGLPTNGVFLIRSSQNSIVVLSRTCTHQGCQVGAFNTGGVATCPCHGSQYNTMGTPVQGPAVNSLTSYSGTLDGNMIEINI